MLVELEELDEKNRTEARLARLCGCYNYAAVCGASLDKHVKKRVGAEVS